MVSKVHKRTASMYRNLQLLRSITYSHSHHKASLLIDASEYIRGLKQKLQESIQLKVETYGEGFLIKVLSERSCEGLLVFILEAFEELGLDVVQARVSCAHNFCLEALGNKVKNEDTHPLDAHLVEQVVSQAIQKWMEISQL